MTESSLSFSSRIAAWLSAFGRVLNVPANPIWKRSVRARLRPAHWLSWGLMTLVLTAFVFTIVYMTTFYRAQVTPLEAARATIIPLIVIQAIIMTVLGTGAVAGGIAKQRADKLLDYQRLTPMSPASKIVGYLFGLPVREYFLFALTLPFMAYALHVGQVPLGKIAQFYVVFFSSVWVYHMTGLVAGMVSPHPWRTGIVTVSLVLGLYIVVPQLSFFGMGVFEFLTFRPTLYAMVMEELPSGGPRWAQVRRALLIARWREVAFFDFNLHPTAFTLLLQGFVIAALSVVVHRKWVQEARHVFSKVQALLVHAGLLVFVLGSIWPLLLRDRLFDMLADSLDAPSPTLVFWMLLILLLAVSGVAAFGLMYLTAPSHHTTLQGHRRAAKLGRPRLGLNSDAATSVPLCVAMIVLMAVGFGLFLRAAGASGRFFEAAPAAPLTWAPVLLSALVLLTAAFLCELTTARTFAVILFVIWAVPFLVFLIAVAARDAWVGSSYFAVSSPVNGLYVISTHLLYAASGPSVGDWVVAEPLRPHLGILSRMTLSFYGVAALVGGIVWMRHRKRLKATGRGEGNGLRAVAHPSENPC